MECMHCEKVIDLGTKRVSRFCSKKCYQAYWYKHGKPVEKITCAMPGCDIQFETNRKKKFCSSEHQYKVSLDKKNASRKHKYNTDVDFKQNYRNNWYKSRYGISLDERDAMLEAQKGLCAICQQPPSGNGHHSVLHLDHCHETGAVRSLLCGPCNTAIGSMKDDADRLRKAAEYIDTHKGVTK